jgi:transposase
MYIGIDVDKNFLTIKEIDEEGNPIGKDKISNSLQALERFSQNHEKHSKIALEASSYSMSGYRYLVKQGFEVHMAHPGALRHPLLAIKWQGFPLEGEKTPSAF